MRGNNNMAPKNTQADRIMAALREAQEAPSNTVGDIRKPTKRSGVGKGLASPTIQPIDDDEADNSVFDNVVEMFSSLYDSWSSSNPDPKPRSLSSPSEDIVMPDIGQFYNATSDTPKLITEAVPKSLVERRVETADFKAEGLDINYAYKDYQKGGSKNFPEYNPTYADVASTNATGFSHIVFHHTGPGAVDNQIYAGQKFKEGTDEQLGYHFYIGKDGKIYQGAPLTRRTNHIGGTGRFSKRSGMDIKDVLDLLKNQDYAFNENSIGIGFVAADNSAINDVQIKSGMKLATSLSKQFDIIPEKVAGHGHLDHQSKKHTEGSKATEAWRKMNNLVARSFYNVTKEQQLAKAGG